MKKIMSLMLGLTLALGAANVVFGQDKPADSSAKTKKAKKAKKTKKTTDSSKKSS